MPVDGGTHVVTGAAPGRKDWEKRIVLKPSGDTVTVAIPELESPNAAPAAPQPASAQPPPAQQDVTTPVQPRAGGLSGQKIGALAAGGVGVAGVVVGSIFGLKAFSKHDEAAKACELRSDQNCVDVKADGMHAGNISTVAFIAGAVGLTGAAVLWFTDKSDKSAAPQVGLGPSGLVVKGAW
jgi:hypothetical protein